MSVRFSNKLVAELFQPFWAALQAGEFLTDAAAVAQTHRHRGLAWLREAGGVRPRRGRDLQGRYLAFGEREEIALGLARSESMRQIAARLGRSVSTISREVRRCQIFCVSSGLPSLRGHCYHYDHDGRTRSVPSGVRGSVSWLIG